MFAKLLSQTVEVKYRGKCKCGYKIKEEVGLLPMFLLEVNKQNTWILLPPPRWYKIHDRCSVCQFVCLLAGLLLVRSS